MKITHVRWDINKIIPYSAMKIIANIFPSYSILNPETNSLSLSAWSVGVRLVSAMHVNIHNVNIVIFINEFHSVSCIIIIVFMFKDHDGYTIVMIIKIRQIS